MSILDKLCTFSDAQAVTASAASDEKLDTGVQAAEVQDFVEKGGRLYASVKAAFTGVESLAISVEVDDDINFGSPVVLFNTAVVPEADLVAGYKFRLPPVLPAHLGKQYMRLYYTATGAGVTAGTINAGIVVDDQTNGM